MAKSSFHVPLHLRLFASAAAGAVAGFILPWSWPFLLRAMIGWDFAATLYLVLITHLMVGATPDKLRRRAEQQDESGWTILFLAGGAATFSLCASVGLLSDFKNLAPGLQPLYLALAIYTILVSWFFLHTLFAIHYAGEYFAPGKNDEERGGLNFPNCELPGYVDFTYFSFTIGMTAQTSDTGITTTNMRMLALIHSVITFFFNTVVLALTINIAASAL